MQILDFEKIRSFTKKDFETRFKKYKKFLNYLGNPQQKIKAIIITGSTGKGSTAEYLAEILKSHKIKTGLYTSPHILNITERIKINSVPITRDEMESIRKEIVKKVEKFNRTQKLNYIPTFFEILTLIAFFYFIEKKVELAILEVGLGGRLDATNVANPLLNIITPICIDHTNFLGNTLKEITKEKSEVIKENSYTVLSKNDKKVTDIIKRKCKEINSELFIQGKDFNVSIIEIKDNEIHFLYKDLSNQWNFSIKDISTGAVKSIALAIFSANLILKNKFNKTIKKSIIEPTIKKIKIPARFQKLEFKTKIFIIDGAHNQAAMREFVRTLKLYNYCEGDLIFSTLCDKEINSVMKELANLTDKIILTQINHPRKAEIITLYEIAKKYFKEIILTGNLNDAIKICLNSDKKYIWVTGSFYLCAELLKDLKF